VSIPRDVRGLCAYFFREARRISFNSRIQEALQIAREEFALGFNAVVGLRVDMAVFEPLSTAGEVELTRRSWGLLVELTGTLFVTVVQTPAPSEAQPSVSQEGLIQIFVKLLTGKLLSVRLRTTNTISDLANIIQDSEGIPARADHQRLIYCGKQLEWHRTLASYNIGQGGTIHLVLRLRGDKPVIYLQSPKDLTATVSLSLSHDWSFSATYPSAPVTEKHGKDCISWTVDVKDNGRLLHDIRTATDVTYLYWEA